MINGSFAPESSSWDIRGLANVILSELFCRLDDLVASGSDSVSFYYDENEWHIDATRSGKTISVSSRDGDCHDTFSLFNIDSVTINLRFDRSDCRFVDGFFCFDPDEHDDGGSVIVIVEEKSGEVSLPDVRRLVRGTLSHELYHAGCRAYGRSSTERSSLDFEEHRRDPEEVGARVEEALSQMTGRLDNARDFKESLCRVITEYLSRNDCPSDNPNFESFYDEMLELHMTEYRWVMGLFG